MKKPDECANIQEVRDEIDIIDREVIEALSKRFQYVIAAQGLKRVQLALDRQIAFRLCYSGRSGLEESGLNPEVVENIYRVLVNYYIDEELKHYKYE